MTSKKRLNILMADDGSQHARSAVELLGDVTLPPRSKVTVLRVFTPGQITSLPELEKSLEATRERLLQKGITAQTEVILGSPAEKVIEIAEKRKTDLIVLGAKGLRATLGILLGGVAQQVVEYACCPVLIGRAPYRGLHRILAVTDGSPNGQRAVRYLLKFPLPEYVDVRIMHVLPPAQQPILTEPYLEDWLAVGTPTLTEMEPAEREKQERKGKALLDRTCEMLRRGGIIAIPTLARGDAATEILEYANANQVDLILAGSRGLSQFRSWWVGSVSRKLVHYSNCSVLVVKGPRKE